MSKPVSERLTVFESNKIRQTVRHTADLLSPKKGQGVKEREGDRWAADMQRRVIIWRALKPYPPFDKLDNDSVLALLTHEAGHLNYTTDYKRPAVFDPWPMQFHRAVNFLEDIRIERLMAQEFPGYQPIRLKEMPKFIEAQRTMIPDYPGLDQVGFGLINREYGGAPVGKPKFQKFVDDVWPEIDYWCSNAKDTNELVVQAVIPLLKALRQILDPEDSLSQPEPQQGGGAPGGGKGMQKGQGQGQAGQAGDDGSGGDPDGSPGQGSDGDGQPSPGGIGRGKGRADAPLADFAYDPKEDGKLGNPSAMNPLSFRDLAQQIHDELVQQGHKNLPTVKQLAEMIQQEYEAAQEAIEAQGHQRMLKTADEGQEIGGDPRTSPGMWDGIYQRVRTPSTLLRRRLQSVLRTNRASAWTENQSRGRVNVTRSHRVAYGNYRVFRKPTTVGTHDYTFGILVDTSGSMSGRAAKSAEAVVLIGDALEKAGLNWFVIPWDDGVKGGVKKVDDRFASRKDVVASAVSRADGGTYEAPALLRAKREFDKIKTGRKVLITISDGQTTSPQDSAYILAEMKQTHKIDSISIGLGCPAPAHYDIRLNNLRPGDLAVELPHLIKMLVRKGG